MLDRCSCCNRDFKSIWDYPNIEIVGLEKISPQDVPEVITLSNEERRFIMPRSVSKKVALFLRRNFGIPLREDTLDPIPEEVVRYFSDKPLKQRYLSSNGLIYSPSLIDSRVFVCAPNRATAIKEAIFENSALKEYFSRLEQMRGQTIPPALLNPGFSDFFELPKLENTRAQFLSLLLDQDIEKRQVGLNVGAGEGSVHPVFLRELKTPILRIATLSYSGVF